MSAVWNKILELVGLRRTEDSVAPFRTWHSYAVVLVAALVIVALARFS